MDEVVRLNLPPAGSEAGLEYYKEGNATHGSTALLRWYLYGCEGGALMIYPLAGLNVCLKCLELMKNDAENL
jgi:hypothetical protein